MTAQRRRAYALVQRALTEGALERQPCERCGTEPEFVDRGPDGIPYSWVGHQVVIAHHDDYSKPLDVRWLCRWCHADFHRFIGSYANNGKKTSV